MHQSLTGLVKMQATGPMPTNPHSLGLSHGTNKFLSDVIQLDQGPHRIPQPWGSWSSERETAGF